MTILNQGRRLFYNALKKQILKIMTDENRLKLYRHCILEIQSRKRSEPVNFCNIIPIVSKKILGNPITFNYKDFPDIFKHRPLINYCKNRLFFRSKERLGRYYWWDPMDEDSRVKILHKAVKKLEHKLGIK